MPIVKGDRGRGDGFSVNQSTAVGDGRQVRFTQRKAGVAVVGFADHRGR